MALENRQLCPLGEREGGHSGRCEGSKWLGPLPSENLEVSLLRVPLCSHLRHYLSVYRILLLLRVSTTNTQGCKEAAFRLQMEFGVVYSCVEDKMYTGRRGRGAFCNGQKLQVSRQEGRLPVAGAIASAPVLWFGVLPDS